VTKFDQYFETVTKDRKRIERTQIKVGERLDTLEYGFEKLEEFAKVTMKATVDDIFSKNMNIEEQFYQIDKDI